jgi:catechol 2,3-dioxygenase-like lactoylglutathione lyase family enzyme
MTATPEFVRGVDFVGVPTHDLATAAKFYGETLGLPRSVYIEDRHFSEFETGNLTLSVYNAEKMGLPHEVNRNPVALHVDDVAASRKLLEEPASASTATSSIPGSATWRCSQIRTGTR